MCIGLSAHGTNGRCTNGPCSRVGHSAALYSPCLLVGRSDVARPRAGRMDEGVMALHRVSVRP